MINNTFFISAIVKGAQFKDKRALYHEVLKFEDFAGEFKRQSNLWLS